MKEREKTLLNYIIKEHIRTGEPVGSDFLAEKRGLKFSSATIRNEMSALEAEDYLTHPYTSAGRIPTEKGYCFYLENFLKEKELSEKIKKKFEKIKQEFKKTSRLLLKEIAKNLTDISKEAVLVAFDSNDVYFTGLTNLLKKPEFKELESLYSLSEIIDHFDEQIGKIFSQINEEIKVVVGRENPFGDKCGLIISCYHFPKKSKGVIAILGPMRMDYERNISLLKYINKLLKN